MMKRTKGKKIQRVGQANCYLHYEKLPSLSLPIIGAYIGDIKIACITELPKNIGGKHPYEIQTFLLHLPVMAGRFISLKEAKKHCAKIAIEFVKLLNNE